MNTYQEKQEARKERYLERASKAETKASEHKKTSDRLVEHIPFGQPILVGHHSESSHRNTLKRSQNHMFKMCDELDKAKYYEDKAESVGKGGISSDDPEALKQLKTKLNRLQQGQEEMKRINKDFKTLTKGIENYEWIAILNKITYSHENVKKCAVQHMRFGHTKLPFPSYSTTNNNARIRTVKKRIEHLEKVSTQETTEVEVNGVRIVDNVEENRLQLFFDDKPPEEVRTKLKQSGFRWSRYNGCWQRHRSTQANWSAQSIIESL